METAQISDSGIQAAFFLCSEQFIEGLPAEARVPPSVSGIGNLGLAMIDAPLDDRVLTALERNPHLARRNLRFETDHGRVTLRGVVASYYQKQMAQEVVRYLDGVHEIANELEVCWA
jgi:osmotically-inducible protein OsmY